MLYTTNSYTTTSKGSIKLHEIYIGNEDYTIVLDETSYMSIQKYQYPFSYIVNKRKANLIRKYNFSPIKQHKEFNDAGKLAEYIHRILRVERNTGNYDEHFLWNTLNHFGEKYVE